MHEGDVLSDWLTPPNSPPNGWYQRRGYALERIISRILTEENLEPRIHIRPSGEEIDGSFVFAERTFLIEAKWRKDPIPASDFYAFKGKVDGKLVGTIGVFISMSGFSPDAVDALKFGKEINLILFNGSDFQHVVENRISFKTALRTKLRYAADEGQPFLPLSAGPDSISASTEPDFPALAQGALPLIPGMANIVVESAADQEGMQILLERIDSKLGTATRVWPAGGQLNIASLLRQLDANKAANLAAVLENDIPMASLNEVREEISAVGGRLLIVTPSLEYLLESACDPDYLNMAPPTSNRKKTARRLARNADIDLLLSQNRHLADFIKWLRNVVSIRP